MIKARELEKDLGNLRERNSVNHKEFFDRLAIIDTMDAVQREQYGQIINGKWRYGVV